jgi:hypothetical protein
MWRQERIPARERASVRRGRRLDGVVTLVALSLAASVGTFAHAPAALAHQTAIDNKAAVTVHVNPDDEPIAGRTAYLYVTKVAVGRRARFRWSRCGCRLTVTSAGGEPIVDMDVRSSKAIPIVFPQDDVYTIGVSGRYRKRRRWKPFSVNFAIRAVPDGSTLQRKDDP